MVVRKIARTIPTIGDRKIKMTGFIHPARMRELNPVTRRVGITLPMSDRIARFKEYDATGDSESNDSKTFPAFFGAVSGW